MRLLILLTLSLLFSISIDGAEANWKTKIADSYPSGQVQKIVLVETIEGKECAVKYLEYYEDGTLKCESDLAPIPNEITPHGGSVSYYPDGKIKTIYTYFEGKKDGVMQHYSKSGKLLSQQEFDEGVPSGPYVIYDAAGLIVEQGHYLNGALHGELVTFYPNGQKKKSVTYANGRLVGKMTSWYDTGAIAEVQTYFMGALSDLKGKPAITRYNADQKVIEIINMEFGEPHGYAVQYHANGKEKYKLHYVHGKKDGKECYWGENGEILGEAEFRDGTPIGKHYRKLASGVVIYSAEFDNHGKLLQPISECDNDGKKSKEYYLQNGILEGTYLEWYPNKQIMNQFHFKNGHFDGEQKSFYPSGKLAVRVKYQNQKREGLQEEWHDNGAKMLLYSYKSGIKDGDAKAFFANGKPKYQATYKQGALHGLEVSWHENGQMQSRQSFKDGLKHGSHTKWAANGDCLLEQEWALDVPHGYHQEWYSDSHLKSKVHFTNGIKDGLEEEYHLNGKPKFRTRYVQGELDGEYLAWYEDGKLHKEYSFVKGKAVGDAREFHPVTKDGKHEIALKMKYQQGSLDGEQAGFYANGKKKALFYYKDGALHGKKMLWTENGDLIYEANFNMGNLDGQVYQKFPDGSEVKQLFKENLPHGLYVLFYPNGKKAKEMHYVRGQIEGELCEFSDAGTKTVSAMFKNIF